MARGGFGCFGVVAGRIVSAADDSRTRGRGGPLGLGPSTCLGPATRSLLAAPTDLAGFGALLRRLLGDPALGQRLGESAWERVCARYLGVRHLIQYAELLAQLDEERGRRRDEPDAP